MTHILTGIEYPELRILELNESRQELTFTDNSEDKKYYEGALFKKIYTKKDTPETKYYFYLNLKAPKLNCLNIGKSLFILKEDKEVVHLDGHKSQFNRTYTLDISTLSNLQEIVSNSINIPLNLKVGPNDKLKTLNFFNNNLTDFSIFNNFPNLKKLDVRGCSEGADITNLNDLRNLVLKRITFSAK